MRKLYGMYLFAVLMMCCGCSGGSMRFLPTNSYPVLGQILYTSGVLVVPVYDVDGDDITITITVPPGLAADKLTEVVHGGEGNAVFAITGAPEPVAAGITVTADDGHGGTDTAQQMFPAL